MGSTEKAGKDFIKPAQYLVYELFPTYLKLASAEKSIYSSLFGKRKKANNAKIAFERLLGLTAAPVRQITNDIAYTKNQGHEYAEKVQLLYHRFVDMTEGRVLVLKEYLSSGISEKTKQLNEKALTSCAAFDALFPHVKDATDSMYETLAPLMQLMDM